MQYRVVCLVLSVLLPLASAAPASADGLSFTLEEVEAGPKPSKPAKAPAVDTDKAIAQALGDVHWGMSKQELVKLLKQQLQADFERRIKLERDVVRQDALYEKMRELLRRMQHDFIEFDGEKSGWDVSPIASEFRQGNGEAMLVVMNGHSRELYFFMKGKLWKWYRELAPDSAELAGADDGLDVLRARFGRGRTQKDRKDDGNDAYEGTTWSDGSTRATALQRGGDVCLIFEDTRVAEHLSSLRKDAPPKVEKGRAALAVESVLMTGSEIEARDRR
jgi:hypothetical protein